MSKVTGIFWAVFGLAAAIVIIFGWPLVFVYWWVSVPIGIAIWIGYRIGRHAEKTSSREWLDEAQARNLAKLEALRETARATREGGII